MDRRYLLGTEIELTIGGISIDFCKNYMGNDHGFLFQESDRTRVHAEGINYDYYKEHPDKYLAEAEAAFVRPLKAVLPRLDLTGHTIEAAKAEYEALIQETEEFESEYAPILKSGLMTFEEFCEFCGRFPLNELDNAYFDFHHPDRDLRSQGRFAGMLDEMQRIPNYSPELYWSERSFFGSSVAVLSPYAMLQVFGKNPRQGDEPVVWQYGPLVEAGWAKVTDFNAGTRRKQTILVATEGTSDARIIEKALNLLKPDIADFFRFIDVNERHHFWGTGALTKFAEGLVRIDVQNKVLFVLDNDAEGIEAYRRLLDLNMPANMGAMVLPEMDCFKDFPARGPGGINPCDINQRAAGIECYLDLNLPGRPPAQVVWSNYKSELDIWHGALEHKDSFAKHFYRQNDEDLMSDRYDTTKLQAILDALFWESVKLSEIPKWLQTT